MIEITGNIWDHRGKGVVVITANGSLTRDGRAVLGRGVARQALAHLPDLPERLGALILSGGNHVHDLGEGIVSFPVEETAWSLPDPRLIGRSAAELRSLANEKRWQRIVVPRPGCGGGGLPWAEVAPLLAAELDDRFLIISTP
jgi:hypothetical protein